MVNKLDPNSSVPLYQQLVEALKDAIANGEFKLNDKIPTELELSKKFGISRITVRAAIDELVEEGILVKRQGKDTFVISSPSDKLVTRNPVEFMSFTRSCELAGRTPSTKLLRIEIEPAVPPHSEFLNLPDGSNVIKITRVRYADGLPVVLETNYFSTEYSFLLNENLEQSLYAVLQQHDIYPMRGLKKISICYANRNEVNYLDVENNSALLLIKDYVYDQFDRPLHYCKQVVRSDRYELAFEVVAMPVKAANAVQAGAV